MAAAVTEEIVFRGVFFRLSEASLGTPLALLTSAMVFGLIHFLNRHATVQGAASIIFESGVLLAAAFVVTRRLWFPIGMHFAWNFTQGGLFGVAVSGSATPVGIAMLVKVWRRDGFVQPFWCAGVRSKAVGAAPI